MAVDGYLNFDTRISTKGFSKGINAMNGMLKGLASAIGVAFSVTALVAFSKQAVGLASDMQEVQNVVDTAFGEMSYKMEQFANTSIKLYGISRLAAKQTGSTFMAMASGMNIALDTASDMAIALTGLSADMASFYNVSQDVASTALKSVFTGETETLKQFGIVMTQTNLEAYALSQGITKSYKAMTEAEKVMLRYGFVMKSTALAQGDFAKTSGGWANQIRILSEQWKEFSSIVGSALMNVALPAVRTLNEGLSSLISYANNAYNALANFFGWEQVQTSAAGITTQIAASVDEQNALTDAVNATAKAQENALAGFDKINKLSGSADTSAPTGTAVTPMVNTQPAVEQAEQTADRIESIFSGAFGNVDFTPLLNSLERLKQAALPITGHIGGGLRWVYDEVLTPLGSWVIEDALPVSLDAAANALEGLDAAWSVIAPVLKEELWDEFLKPIGKWTGDLAVKGIEGLGKNLKALSESLTETDVRVFLGMAEAIAGVWLAVKGYGLASAIAGGISTTFTATIIPAFKSGIAALGATATLSLSTVFAGIGAAFAGWSIGSMIYDIIGEEIDNVLHPFFDAWVLGAESIWNSLKKLGAGLSDAFKKDLSNAGEIWNEYWDMSGALEDLKKDASEAKKMWDEYWKPLTDFAAAWYNFWEDVGGAFYNFVTGWTACFMEFGENAYDVSEAVKTFLVDGWLFVQDAFSNAPKWAKDRMQDIKDGFANAPKWFSEKFQSGWTNIKTAFSADSVKTWFSDRNADIEDAFANVDGFMSEKFGNGWENIKSAFADTSEHFKGIWEDITQAFADGDIGKWFSEQFQKGYDNVTSIFDELDGYFDGIWEDLSSGAKEGINFLLDKLNALGDKIESLLNNVVDGLNAAFSFSIPENVPGIGGTSFGLNMAHVNIPPIPRLATGTVVPANYGEFLAILGDNKREAEIVSPISAMEQAMRNVLTKHSGGDIHLHVDLDGKTVYKTVIRRNNESIRMTGKNPLNPV